MAFDFSTAAPGGAGIIEGRDPGAVVEAEGAEPGTRLARENPHRDAGKCWVWSRTQPDIKGINCNRGVA